MIKRNKKLSLDLPSYDFPLTSTSISTSISPHKFTFQVSVSVSTLSQTISFLRFVQQKNSLEEIGNEAKKVRESLQSQINKKKSTKKRVNIQAVSPIYGNQLSRLVVDSTFQLIRKNNSESQNLEQLKKQLESLRQNYRVLVDKLKQFQNFNTSTLFKQQQQHYTIQKQRLRQYEQLNKEQQAVIIRLSQENACLKKKLADLRQQLDEKIRLISLIPKQERNIFKSSHQYGQDDLLTLITLQAKQLQRI